MGLILFYFGEKRAKRSLEKETVINTDDNLIESEV